MTTSENLAGHATYLAGLEQGELRYQRCSSCGRAVFYPRVLCNHCGSLDLTFAVSGGLGTVYSSTAITQRDSDPYSICLVDLDEGFRMMSTVVDIAADDVRIGMRVAAEFESLGDVEDGQQTSRVVFRSVAP